MYNRAIVTRQLTTLVLLLLVTSCRQPLCPRNAPAVRHLQAYGFPKATPKLAEGDLVIHFAYSPGLGRIRVTRGRPLPPLDIRLEWVHGRASLLAWQPLACDAQAEIAWRIPISEGDFQRVSTCLNDTSLWQLGHGSQINDGPVVRVEVRSTAGSKTISNVDHSGELARRIVRCYCTAQQLAHAETSSICEE